MEENGLGSNLGFEEDGKVPVRVTIRVVFLIVGPSNGLLRVTVGRRKPEDYFISLFADEIGVRVKKNCLVLGHGNGVVLKHENIIISLLRERRRSFSVRSGNSVLRKRNRPS